jgi:flagellar basal body-associated protein FliL
MAEESAKEGSKDKLKFFKKAKSSSDDSAVTVADGKEDVKEAPVETEKEPKVEHSAVSGDEERVEKRSDTPRTPLMPLLAPTLALAVRTLVILAIIVAEAYAAYFLVVRGIAPRMAEGQVVRAAQEADAVEEPAATKEVHAEDEKAAPGVGSITPIEDIVVNPAGSGGTRYLCTTVALESAKPAVAEEVAEREPQIRDALIEILSKRTVEDLSALSTREELRAEIKTAVNDLLVTGEVVGVYLSNFVLQ